MREFIKHLYYNTIVGHILISPAKWLYDIYRFHIILYIYRFLPDKIVIKRTFKKILGYNLNLNNPKRFTEKIQWLKLNDRKPLHTLCADKYAVREYIKEKIGQQYLIPLVYHTYNPADIIHKNLPNYPCIIKTNHNSGGGVIIKDKSNVDWKSLQKHFTKLLKINYYHTTAKGWVYKNIKPKIIVEKLLKDESGNDLLNDYKIHCFNEKPLYIQTIFDRANQVKEDWYDINWNHQDAYYYSPIKKDIQKPKMLRKMLELAEIISKDFIYIRVDLYLVYNKIYFGELTFHPHTGYMRFVPESFDKILGDRLKLPID